MKSVKRFEIVIGSPHLHRLVETLKGAGARGYTVIPGVSGTGDRGMQWADDPGGASDNELVICVVEPEIFEHVAEAIRPLLVRYGGMCLISDGAWIRD